MNTAVTRLVAERRFYVGAAIGVVVVVLAGCVVIDTLRYRRLHPAFVLGGLLMFVTDPVAQWVAATSQWAQFCLWLR